MTAVDHSKAIDIANLELSALGPEPVLVKSARKGILSVKKDDNVVRVSSPWLEGEATFELADEGQANTAAYWTRGATTVMSRDIHVGQFIDNALAMPFFSVNVPKAGIPRPIADYDSRN